MSESRTKPTRPGCTPIRRIKELREKLGKNGKPLSLDAFVDGLQYKTSKSSISDYENGNASANIDILLDIAFSYGVSVDWLLGIDDEPSIDEDVTPICQYTGLSGDAIKMLNYYKENNIERVKFISFLLEQDSEYFRSQIINNKNSKHKIIPHRENRDSYPDFLDDVESLIKCNSMSDKEFLLSVLDRGDFYFKGQEEPLPLRNLKDVDFKDTKLLKSKLKYLVTEMYARRLTNRLERLGKVYDEWLKEHETVSRSEYFENTEQD